MKTKSPSSKPPKEEKPNHRHEMFLGLNRKEQLMLAEYGPDAIANPTFPFVLQISRCRSPKFNNFGEDYSVTPKEEFFRELIGALDSGEAEIFRKLASALESVARVEKGEYYNTVARELLLADRPPHGVGKNLQQIWGADLVTRKDILVRARRKVRSNEGDGQYRNLDRLARTLDVVLGKAKRGRKKANTKSALK